MNWNSIDKTQQIELIKQESADHPVLIFKHSTSCSISRTVLDRLERNWKDADVAPAKAYFLDLLSHRDVSNQLADEFDIQHESPQAMVIKNGRAVYHTSHFDIDYAKLQVALKN